jgi:DNA-binding XRE family transcriptional regulator
MKVVELLETVAAMVVTEEKLKWWLAREVRHLRENYSAAHGGLTQKEFAAHVGTDWKNIYNIEEQNHMPKVDLLNQIVAACESNLAKFFMDLFTRMELTEIERSNKEEAEMIFTLVKGLSNPVTKKFLGEAAKHVEEVLRLIEAQ